MVIKWPGNGNGSGRNARGDDRRRSPHGHGSSALARPVSTRRVGHRASHRLALILLGLARRMRDCTKHMCYREGKTDGEKLPPLLDEAGVRWLRRVHICRPGLRCELSHFFNILSTTVGDSAQRVIPFMHGDHIFCMVSVIQVQLGLRIQCSFAR